MRIVVMTDVHANLPALDAALKAIRAEGCDAIFHTGDAIAIGPYPAECLELLLNTPDTHFVMGNHDAYYVDGLPTPRPAGMSDGAVQHQHWTHSRLDPQWRPALAGWPYVLEVDFGSVKAMFVHYALEPAGHDFQPVITHPTAVDLDRMFGSPEAALVFYGHDHHPSDVKGRARYVNPGSLGCHCQAVARYCVVELGRGRYSVVHREVAYDDAQLLGAFERRRVPLRRFIYRAFFGGRFCTDPASGD